MGNENVFDFFVGRFRKKVYVNITEISFTLESISFKSLLKSLCR